jgi:hypothetical protein
MKLCATFARRKRVFYIQKSVTPSSSYEGMDYVQIVLMQRGLVALIVLMQRGLVALLSWSGTEEPAWEHKLPNMPFLSLFPQKLKCWHCFP